MPDTPAERRAKRAWENREKAKDPEGFKQRQRDAQKRYHEKHKEELRERRRLHRLQNLEAERARGRAEYAKNREARAEASRKWKANNREKFLAGSRLANLKKYGLTPESKEALFLSQGSACAACGSPDPRGVRGWHIDHDHITGKVRGIVCLYCNVALGKVEDSVDRLKMLIAYLEKHSA